MTYIEDYGLDSPPRKLLLLALSIVDGKNNKAMDKLRIQKVIRFFEYLTGKKEVDFSNYKLGGVSYELDENRENLIEYELIAQNDKWFNLTQEGDMAVGELCKIISTEDYNQLVFAKQKLNDLTDDEMLYFMYKTIPETQVYSTEFQRLDRKKQLIVDCLFSKRKIDVRTASKWLGITEKEFVKLYPKKELSGTELQSLIDGYKASAADDLETAKSFESIENLTDEFCDA